MCGNWEALRSPASPNLSGLPSARIIARARITARLSYVIVYAIPELRIPQSSPSHPRYAIRMGSRTSSPALPHELWRQIISDVSLAEQRTCLAVSRLLRELALPFVFSHITVRLGIWRDMADPLDGWTDAGKMEAKNATRRSLELLQHVVECAEFARLVRKVTVCAFTPEGDEHPEEAIRGCCCYDQQILLTSRIGC